MLSTSLLAFLSVLQPLAVAAAAPYEWPQREPLGPQLEARAFQLFTTIGPQTASGTAVASAPAASQTGAHSQHILTAPDPPGNTDKVVTWQLWESADALTDPARGNSILSVPQKGNFLGYSIELSVANQVREYRILGTRATCGDSWSKSLMVVGWLERMVAVDLVVPARRSPLQIICGV